LIINHINLLLNKIVDTEMSVDEIMEIVVADVDFYRKSNGGIKISGDEPIMQLSFLQGLLKKCKDVGINKFVAQYLKAIYCLSIKYHLLRYAIPGNYSFTKVNSAFPGMASPRRKGGAGLATGTF